MLKGALTIDPDFLDAKTALAINYWQQVETGVFGADMQVELVNDGPVTLFVDSHKLF